MLVHGEMANKNIEITKKLIFLWDGRPLESYTKKELIEILSMLLNEIQEDANNEIRKTLEGIIYTENEE